MLYVDDDDHHHHHHQPHPHHHLYHQKIFSVHCIQISNASSSRHECQQDAKYLSRKYLCGIQIWIFNKQGARYFLLIHTSWVWQHSVLILPTLSQNIKQRTVKYYAKIPNISPKNASNAVYKKYVRDSAHLEEVRLLSWRPPACLF